MFRALGSLVVRGRWGVIIGWFVAAVVIAVAAPALESTQDQSEFLPSHYESVKALAVQQEASRSGARSGRSSSSTARMAGS